MPLSPDGKADADAGTSSGATGTINVGDMADGAEAICQDGVGVSDIAACAQCVAGMPHVCASSSSANAQGQPPRSTSASSWHSDVMGSSAAAPSLKVCHNCGISSALATNKDVCSEKKGYVVHHRFVKQPQKRAASERKPGSGKGQGATTAGASSSLSVGSGSDMRPVAASSASQSSASAQPPVVLDSQPASSAQASAAKVVKIPAAEAIAAANALVERFTLMHEIQGFVQANQEAATADVALRKQYGTFLAKLSHRVEEARALLSNCEEYATRRKDIDYVDKHGGLMGKYTRGLVRLRGTVDLKSCDSAGITLDQQQERARDAWANALAANPAANPGV